LSTETPIFSIEIAPTVHEDYKLGQNTEHCNVLKIERERTQKMKMKKIFEDFSDFTSAK
jgi:hypothetical protein